MIMYTFQRQEHTLPIQPSKSLERPSLRVSIKLPETARHVHRHPESITLCCVLEHVEVGAPWLASVLHTATVLEERFGNVVVPLVVDAQDILDLTDEASEPVSKTHCADVWQMEFEALWVASSGLLRDVRADRSL